MRPAAAAARGNPQMVSKDNITERTSFRPLSTTGQPLPQIISIFFGTLIAAAVNASFMIINY